MMPKVKNDFDIQQLISLKDNPIDINDSKASFSDFPLLNSLQINNLINYREMLGKFISVYELQAVPGFTVEVIKQILPYITVSQEELSFTGIKKRFLGWETNSWLFARLLFLKFRRDLTVMIRPIRNTFTGSRPKFFFRYKYQYRNLLQYGLTGEKDAGEMFGFKKAKYGFDFYSFHFFIRNVGIIKSLALGDFTINLGQGLIHWQSQAFKKSSAVIDVKRQSETLRPYQSAGEYNFHRGIAITLDKKAIEATLFVSFKKLSANIGIDDNYGEVITSLQTSGLHRTTDELNSKDIAQLFTAGGNIKYQRKRGHAGINFVSYQYSLPLLKRDEPYNLYSIKGNQWLNYSSDYSYTLRNCHFFGELAIDKNLNKAFINGLMASVHESINVSFVYRHIDKAYQSVYGNAFTENTMPSNETGIYMGLSIKPGYQWKIDLYGDAFRFPWLKYRVDAPASGMGYLAQLNWKPNKQVEVYSRFRFRSKPLNSENIHSNYPGDHIIKNWRTHVSYQVTRNILLRSRVEACWFVPQKAGTGSNRLFIIYRYSVQANG